MKVENKNFIDKLCYFEEEIIWPDIEPIFLNALRIALNFIFDELNPIGIFLGGSHFKGQVHKNSDLDIIIIENNPKFRRIFRIFEGIPTDFHIESPASFPKHLDAENISPYPKLAYICANSFTIYSQSPLIEELKILSNKFINEKFPCSQDELNRLKYISVNFYTDAVDTVMSDPTESAMFSNLAVIEMIKYHYRVNNDYIPKFKNMINDIELRNSLLGKLLKAFYNNSDSQKKIEIIRKIANNTIGNLDYFEFDCPVVHEKFFE